MKISKKQYDGWTSPNKASYLSFRYGLPITIIGTITGLVALAFTVIQFNQSKIKSEAFNKPAEAVLSSSQKRTIFTMAQELKFNSDWIYNLIKWQSGDKFKPIGGLKTEALMKVLSEHYDEATKYSYGEEKYIYQLGLELDAIGKEILAADKLALAEFENNSGYTLEDIYFLIEFLRWYTQYLVKENLTENELNSLGWTAFPYDNHFPAINEKANYKRFSFVENAEKSFGYYLGTID